jgi:hypothetical protein
MRHRLGLKGFVGFSCNGLSGGLALFWHDQIIVEVQTINERFIGHMCETLPMCPSDVLLVFMVNPGLRIDLVCGKLSAILKLLLTCLG